MINLEELGEAILEGAYQALGQGAQLVAQRARAKAPVRRIFRNAGYAVRFKSMAEINESRYARDAGLRVKSPPTVVQPDDVPLRWGRTIAGKKPGAQWRQRRMSVAQQHLQDYDAEMARRRMGLTPHKTVLTRRGAYEVRSMRAKHLTWGHSYIGGTLRDSIVAEPVSISGNRAEAWVIAKAPYAKYQEFGTRHNAAHPFLRPAAEESRAEVVAQIADAVRRASRTGASQTQIEIVVRL